PGTCDHKAGATAQEHHAEGAEHSCSMTEHENCPLKGKKVAETTDVTLSGKLLCRRCNLKETETCEKVFVSGETRHAVCLGGELKQAEAASEHGEATLEVTGELVKAEDGSSMLRILSAKKKA
ncbi:MAG TPA: hypothetical protein VGF40_03715, partial [Thermoanaerobaculia bacterium]